MGALAVSAFGLLSLVVMGVGAVAIAAESMRTWSMYFVLEQTVATVTPVSLVLLGTAVVAGVLVAATAS
jgi:hypothetical protein